MTTETPPSPGNTPGMPNITELHTQALLVMGLIDAMNDLRDRVGPQGGPLAAVIEATWPLMRKLTDDLEKLYENAN